MLLLLLFYFANVKIINSLFIFIGLWAAKALPRNTSGIIRKQNLASHMYPSQARSTRNYKRLDCAFIICIHVQTVDFFSTHGHVISLHLQQCLLYDNVSEKTIGADR